MKKIFYEFIDYVYTDYVKENWDIFTKTGKFFLYPFWFIRSILIWIISPILFIPFSIKRSKKYIDFENKKEKMISEFLKK